MTLAAATPSSALDLGMIQLHGYLDLEYTQATKNEGKDNPQATGMDNGSFDIHHFNLLMDLTVRPELTAHAMVEFDHGADTERQQGDIILEYAFGEYIFHDWAKLRGGKMLTPYGLYNEIHDASPAFLSVFIPETMYMATERGGFPMMPKWITGMGLRGEAAIMPGHHDIDYTVYIGNGENLASTNESAYDDNANKAVGGRIQFTTHEETLQAGLSGFYGDKAVTPDNLSETHWTLIMSLNYNFRNLNVRGEYGHSRLGDRKEISWYAQGSWRFGRYTPYIRIQQLEPDVDQDDDLWSTYLAGLNIKVNDNLFFKVEWDEHRRGANNTAILREGGEDFGEFRSALTLFF